MKTIYKDNKKIPKEKKIRTNRCSQNQQYDCHNTNNDKQIGKISNEVKSKEFKRLKIHFKLSSKKQ